jgi:hypothetical protein
MFILEDCMKNKIKLCYKKNNIDIEKFIKLKYPKMLINDNEIIYNNNTLIVKPRFR